MSRTAGGGKVETIFETGGNDGGLTVGNVEGLTGLQINRRLRRRRGM